MTLTCFSRAAHLEQREALDGDPKSAGDTAGADLSQLVQLSPLSPSKPLPHQLVNLFSELLSMSWPNTREGALAAPLSLHSDLEKVAFVSKVSFPLCSQYLCQHPLYIVYMESPVIYWLYTG